MDTETPPYCNNLGGWSKGFLPTLTEATFRPLSPHCCSFTAVIWDGCDRQGVSFGQLARLIENIGYIGKIDDFTIKPRQQHSFFLTGFSRHTSSLPLFGGATLSTLRRQAVTTSMRRVPDPRMAEPLMPGLLHREGVIRQAAMTMVV